MKQARTALREARLRAGLPQAGLAQRAHTSQPTIAPAPLTVAKADIAPAAPVAAPAVTVASPKARVREAFAQLPLSEQLSVDAKKPEVRPQPRHKVARARPLREPQQPMMMMQQPTMMVAQQPHFGLFGSTW